MGVESVYGTRKAVINYGEDHMATYSECFNGDSGRIWNFVSVTTV